MFQDRVWEERNVMVDLGEPFEDARRGEVVTSIRTIELMRRLGESSVEKVKASAGITGAYFLTLLPKKVCKFTYSETLPEITATRETGTESWDAKQALDWGLDYGDEEVANRKRDEIGEIA
jgi:hypothetical protein